MHKILEKDWKLIRTMKDKKLAIACRLIFEKFALLISQSEGMEHETYLKIWKTIREEDRKIGLMFDELSRSSAVLKLMTWKKNGLLSAEEESMFSIETQEKLNLF